jgi:hypothetical protein
MFLKDWNGGLEERDPTQTALNVRSFIILLELPGLYDVRNLEFLDTILKKALFVKKEVSDMYIRWISEFTKERFERLFHGLSETLGIIVRKPRKQIDKKV